VDVDGVDDEEESQEHVVMDGENDEDTVWAEEDPDEDVRGWKMKIVMEEEADLA
jgi:COMPASS component SWD1